MYKAILLSFSVGLLSACSLNPSSTQLNPISPPKDDPNTPLNETQWRYALDPHGSVANTKLQLITEEGAWIQFHRVPRLDPQNNSWVELIYDIPGASLANQNKIRLTYKSDQPLLIKLSQKDYGSDGDNSYAHYQTRLPKADKWHTQMVDLEDFSRPEWTPSWSKSVGIIKNHVSAVYLVPDLTDKDGGTATLEVQNLELLQ